MPAPPAPLLRHRPLVVGLLALVAVVVVALVTALLTGPGPSAPTGATSADDRTQRPTPGAIAAAAPAPVQADPPHPVVRGARLVDARTGDPLRLAGVNRSGAEYACIQDFGFFDGPVDDAAIARIVAWGTNVVRVPLNSTCWLGINGAPARWSGAAYRDQVDALVDRLHAQGQAVILDLHWSAPGTRQATEQTVAPDADHAPDFWRSVARRYVDDPAVMFELFNEPRDISWGCWRDGCTTPEGWRAVGHQRLVDVVRATGARQPIVLDGLNYGGDLSAWAEYEPTDPLDQLVAGWHIYNFSQCGVESCWDATAGRLSRTTPVLLTETGQDGCRGDFLRALLPWADRHQIGYLGWAWNAADCSAGPSLISDYDGTPTAYGRVFRDHLAATAPDPDDPDPDAPSVRMDFERAGTQGWAVTAGRGTVARTTAGPVRGRASLALTSRSATTTATTRRVSGLAPGDVATLRVRPLGRGAAPAVRPVLATADGLTVLAPQQLRKQAWRTVTVTVPADLAAPAALGLRTKGAGVRLLVDDVAW